MRYLGDVVTSQGLTIELYVCEECGGLSMKDRCPACELRKDIRRAAIMGQRFGVRA